MRGQSSTADSRAAAPPRHVDRERARGNPSLRRGLGVSRRLSDGGRTHGSQLGRAVTTRTTDATRDQRPRPVATGRPGRGGDRAAP
jgi:hypothetical protein